MSARMGLADDLDRELARPAPASPDTEPDDPRIIRIHPERVTVLRDTYGVTPKTNKDVTGNGWRLAILVSEEPEQAPAEVRAKLEAALEVVAALDYDRMTGDEKEADDYVDARCSGSLSSLEFAGLLSLQWDRAWPFAHIEDEALPWASARAWIFRGHVVVTEDSDGHGAETASQREMVESDLASEPAASREALEALELRLRAEVDNDAPVTRDALEARLAHELLLGNEAQLLLGRPTTPEEKRRTREHIPHEVRLAVWKRDGARCVECSTDFDLQYDHIIPVSLGGATSAANLGPRFAFLVDHGPATPVRR